MLSERDTCLCQIPLKFLNISLEERVQIYDDLFKEYIYPVISSVSSNEDLKQFLLEDSLPKHIDVEILKHLGLQKSDISSEHYLYED